MGLDNARKQGTWLGSKECQVQFGNRRKGNHDVYRGAPIIPSIHMDSDLTRWSGQQHTSLLHVVDATTFEHEEIIRVPAIVTDPPQSSSPRSPSASPPSPPASNSQPQPYVHALTTSGDAWTAVPSPALAPPRLPHIPASHLHTHPHGHYYHHYHSAAPLVRHPGSDRERRLRARVRQVRDVLLTTAPSLSASGSGNFSVAAPAAASPVLPRRRPHATEQGAGAEMDVDLDTDAVLSGTPRQSLKMSSAVGGS